MTLKPIVLFLGLLVVACGQPSRRSQSCASALETSSKPTTVQTVSGPVAGYIDDGVYIYKGIPYAQAQRFMPPQDPEPWLSSYQPVRLPWGQVGP